MLRGHLPVGRKCKNPHALPPAIGLHVPSRPAVQHCARHGLSPSLPCAAHPVGFSGRFRRAGRVRYAISEKFASISVSLALVCTLNFIFAFVPAFYNISVKTAPVLTQLRSYPQVNPEYDSVRQIVEDLTQKAATPPTYVYVVGDGGTSISPELLKRSYLPEATDAAPFVVTNSIVDLRNGFPSQLFLSDYILIESTFKTEFQTTQQVSYQVFDLLMNDPAFEEYYCKAEQSLVA